ncbi:hypothetical protein [Commensalibacter melissae]|uniref:hypothetical protein n=1 Tax=Commensalibacter melissae TaxID=2070537 RepID=UPI0011B23467|nr:hypothetical protein [Commensalibacter melissae]
MLVVNDAVARYPRARSIPEYVPRNTYDFLTTLNRANRIYTVFGIKILFHLDIKTAPYRMVPD